MHRRRFLSGAAMLAASTSPLRASPAPLKVGVLNDMTGVFADFQGPGSLLAAQMALEDQHGYAGSRPVEIVFADHQNKPDIGMAIARKWLDQDGVHVILDVPNSAIALAVAKLVTDRNRVFVGVGAGTVDLTGKACSPNIVQWDYDTWETSEALGHAITERGGKTWFTLAADYAFGADLDRYVGDAVRAAGGRVVGGVKAPFPTSDFSSFLLAAQSSGADVVALNNGGGDTINSLKQAAEFGLMRTMQVCGPIYNVNITQAVGLSVAQGVLGVTPFYWDMNDGTRAFSRRYAERSPRHAMPNDMQAGMYSAMLHLMKAAATEVDISDGRALVAAMKAQPTEDPIYGAGRIREDGRKLHPIYLFTTKTPAQSRSDWDYYTILSTIPPDQAFRPMADGGCSFVKA